MTGLLPGTRTVLASAANACTEPVRRLSVRIPMPASWWACPGEACLRGPRG